MIELLAIIETPHFTAGIVLRDDRVIEAAPIVWYMKRHKGTRDQVRDHRQRKGWKVSVVNRGPAAIHHCHAAGPRP